MEELNFIGTDPGAVKYGNFINYYMFHSTAQRIENLNIKMFPISTTDMPILCLDIGCNTGELTEELYSYLNVIHPNAQIYILAVDIDPNLIKRAKESNNNTNISYEGINIMNDLDREPIKDFLKHHGKDMFDFTFCFSVTMWIHLNNGDEGLHTFLQYVKYISKTIIIEPQPWNCYRNAQRRVKKSGSSFPYYQNLKIRSNVDEIIEQILTDSTHTKIYESNHSRWKRKIQSYNLLTT